MAATFLFYDLETSGLSKPFDQVLQFAAIRTDLELNEIERHEYHVKLNPDTIASPEAVITHRIGIEDTKGGLAEVHAMHRIHQLLNTPNTINLGYNTLGFDDEFLRFAFYKNLLPPYSHQFASGCSRADIYPMVILYHLFQKEALVWPEREGRLSLKLEALSQCNQLATGQAHNAMVDVIATVNLAKKLKQHPKMWQYLLGYFNKAQDAQRIQQLPKAFGSHHVGLYVDSKVGYKKRFAAPVLLLGQHYHYKNQTVWLRLDNAQLTSTQSDNIEATTRCFNKKYGEPGFLLPLESHYLSALHEDSLMQYQQNLQWLQAHPDILHAITNHHCDFTFPKIENVDIDGALYQTGFLSHAEQRECQAFHQALSDTPEQALSQITSPALRALAIRCVGRIDQGLLSPAQQKTFSDYLQTVYQADHHLIDYKGEKRITLANALNRAQQLQQDKALDTAQQTLLRNYIAYYQDDTKYR